jgi:CRP-like cAMP-binding protein
MPLNQRDYERLRKQIEDRYRRDIEALERVWEMAAAGSNGQKEPTNGRAPSGTQNHRIEGLTDAIRKVLITIDGTFTLRDIMARLSATDSIIGESIKDKPASVSSALKRLESEGEISVVRKGTGKRPSEYRVGDTPQARSDTAQESGLTDTQLEA